MAVASPLPQLWPKLWHWSEPYRRACWIGLKKMAVWFVPMILTAGAAAYLSYFYNQKANTELALQQQALSDLQDFRSSGAEVDASMSALSDALVDGRGVPEAKARMRGALTKHISDAVANESQLGPGASEYLSGLGQLRTVVDEVDEGSMPTQARLWEESLRLMSQRRKLAASAIINVRGT